MIKMVLFVFVVVGMDGMPYEKYLRDMRRPNAWGGQAELQAASLLFK